MIEGVVAIGVGIVTGSVSLVAFGADSFIEVISAVALEIAQGRPARERRETGGCRAEGAVPCGGDFLPAGLLLAYEAVGALLSREGPENATVGLVLAVVSLMVMPVLAYGKQRTGRELGSEALRADAVEMWVCSYLSLALLAGVALSTPNITPLNVG